MNTKVAIIIPTMNRPDFMLRHFKFYELTKSPHPLYISDSSNEENAEKVKEGIEQFKKLDITYQWVSPGKDNIYSLLPLIREKYCIHVGDDDLIIPKTISECADFLENHPDYAACSGRQVNIRFRKEDYNMPYGIIERQTRPLGRSLEEEDMLMRVKNFWSDSTFINFSVRRVEEVEKPMRNITKHFSLLEHLLDFLLASILAVSGKLKVLDKLGYVMQISDLRYNFDHSLTVNFLVSPDFNEKWKICESGFSEIIRKKDASKEESIKIVRWIFALYLTRQLANETMSLPVDRTEPLLVKHNSYKNKRYFKKFLPLIKKVIYNFKEPQNVNRPESKYFSDFKIVKDFLEKNSA